MTFLRPYSQTVHFQLRLHDRYFLILFRGAQGDIRHGVSRAQPQGIAQEKIHPSQVQIGGHGSYRRSILQGRGFQHHVGGIHMKFQLIFHADIHAIETEYPGQKILALQYGGIRPIGSKT